ncbi:helix-turn-helix domain-containing protein [Streptomyces sp. CLV115]|uniref:helix-turn-helix domain-containing protein n=1 Tax=Streptomyces sp. CLV115 TaxID=3138502 RepID=UPI00313D7130
MQQWESDMHVDGLQEIVDSLADRLQRSVALDDRAIHLIVASKHYGDEDSVRIQSVLGREVDGAIAETILATGIDRAEGPTRIAPMPQYGSKSRVCFPIRYAQLLLGYLWLIDGDNSLTDEQIADASAVTEAIALMMYRRNLHSERRQSLHDALLRELLAADPVARSRAEADLKDEGVLRDTSSVTVVAVQVVRTEGDSGPADVGVMADEAEVALGQVVRQAAGPYLEMEVLTSLQRRRAVLLLAGRRKWSDQHITDVCGRIVDDFTRLTGQHAVVGVGLAQNGLRKAAVSYEQALVAARAAEFLPGLGSVLLWESLGAYALLAQISPHELKSTSYPVPMLRLARSRNAEALMTTAEVYLDLAGDAQRAADALHVHRTTLYQRISRIEEVSGLDLRDGLDRLTLHLGLKLARLTRF